MKYAITAGKDTLEITLRKTNNGTTPVVNAHFMLAGKSTYSLEYALSHNTDLAGKYDQVFTELRKAQLDVKTKATLGTGARNVTAIEITRSTTEAAALETAVEQTLVTLGFEKAPEHTVSSETGHRGAVTESRRGHWDGDTWSRAGGTFD